MSAIMYTVCQLLLIICFINHIQCLQEIIDKIETDIGTLNSKKAEVLSAIEDKIEAAVAELNEREDLLKAIETENCTYKIEIATKDVFKKCSPTSLIDKYAKKKLAALEKLEKQASAKMDVCNKENVDCTAIEMALKKKLELIDVDNFLSVEFKLTKCVQLLSMKIKIKLLLKETILKKCINAEG